MDKDEVVKILRSCLISCKGGIKLDNLKADYRIVAGEPLPFRQFGYSSVEDFIRDMPDITVTYKNQELYVEATPSRTTAHLTKLISRQVSRQRTRRKARPQTKKRNPPQYMSRGYSPGFKNTGSQYVKNNYQDSPGSFTRSTPGKSNLYTDFSRPMPLMETIVQCPLPQNDEKSRFPSNISHIPLNERLKDKINPTQSNQSVNKSKTTEKLKNEVLIEKTVSSVIIPKPKTVEPKSSKLSERLKISANILSPTNNNGHIYPSIISNVSQIAPIDSLDPREALQIHTNSLNLPSPVYKMCKKSEKNGTNVTIYATVKIGPHTFGTFPEDARSEEEAERIAARIALINLAKQLSNAEVTTVDTTLVKERILIIINRHHGGVFMHLLPAYYSEQYGEALPHEWQKIVEKCPDISQEKGVGNSTILCRSIPTSKRPESSRQTQNRSNTPSSEKIQLNPIGPTVPDKLKVPETTLWNVYTTCVVSTLEIWVRLIDEDNNDNYIDMTNKMAEYYNEIKESPISTCIVGDYYAILEDDYWHRVLCIDFESNTKIATVLFIDEGYEDQYKYNMLYPLDKKFCALPTQAIRVALHGLEDFRDCEQIVAEIESQLLDRVFCVKVHSVPTKTDTDENSSYVSVTFYDTSGEDDIDMNRFLLDKILNNIIDASNVQAKQLVELYITHIDEHGKVYAQLNSVKVFLSSLLNREIMSQVPVNMMSSLVRTIDFTKMYFVQLDLQWYRAKVTDIRDDYEIMVFLVDVGRTAVVLRSNLLHMDKISKILQCIPPQAKQIFLHKIDSSMYGEKLVARFKELVSDTDLLLARVVKITISGVPVMEIFKRVGPSNMLASINTSLIYDEELTKSNEDGNNNIKPKKRLERKNSRIFEFCGKLNPPTISDIGHYFDVHVTLAAHPGHFIVQPLDNAGDFKKMMLELQKCCKAYKGPQLKSVGEGKLYAGIYKDCWNRVYVTNIISDDTVSVYFCDFGDVRIVPRNSLQPLKSEFLELPYQAVKAKLVGIQPINTDWSAEDGVRFRDLVLDKDFVSIVVESIFDDFSPANGTVLGLRLIDVSTDKDIYIDQVLVEENRAKFIEEENLPSS